MPKMRLGWYVGVSYTPTPHPFWSFLSLHRCPQRVMDVLFTDDPYLIGLDRPCGHSLGLGIPSSTQLLLIDGLPVTK
jgi:hypothetical protein